MSEEEKYRLLNDLVHCKFFIKDNFFNDNYANIKMVSFYKVEKTDKGFCLTCNFYTLYQYVKTVIVDINYFLESIDLKNKYNKQLNCFNIISKLKKEFNK